MAAAKHARTVSLSPPKVLVFATGVQIIIGRVWHIMDRSPTDIDLLVIKQDPPWLTRNSPKITTANSTRLLAHLSTVQTITDSVLVEINS